MSQESIERLKEIWSSWGLGRYPMGANVQEFISALEEEAGSAPEGASLELLAVQCILLDSESVGASNRPALTDVTTCLGADWSMGDMKDVAFVQAMLLAVRPTAPVLAELMVAGRAAQRGRDKQKPRLGAWLTSGRRESIRQVIGSINAPKLTPRPPPSFAHVDAAVEHLSKNTGQALPYSAIAPHLLKALDELNVAIHKVRGAVPRVNWGATEPQMKMLRENANQPWNYPSFSHELTTILQTLSEGLSSLGCTQAIEPSLGRLIEIRATNHAFGGYGRDVVHILRQVKSELIRIHYIRETQSWHEEYRRWAEAVTVQAQSQMLASAEQKLLWWGQSRYCSPLRLPYRSLRAAPIDLVWWAAVEVAELGKLLEFAPLSAFLVNTLETLGLDVTESRPASAWLSSLAEVLRAVQPELRRHVVPKDPLKNLAAKDALGLPVTWLRLGGEEGELSSAVALDLDLEIDLGDLAEWLLGELLLDHRMAP